MKASTELVALDLRSLPALAPQLPIEPGAVRRTNAGTYLHFAPGRWLIADHEPGIMAALLGSDVVESFDVTGKWCQVSLPAENAQRLLATQMPVIRTLSGRHCAAIRLFDAPAIVAHDAAGFAVWTHRSYLQFVQDAIEQTRERLVTRIHSS
ncbi:hypothetical protein [Steroidobacter sp.]|uniref:hypothetical protein n=1 Tax=Steroidobacter sp. TaxID=1978227 RepID=UPI001A5C6CB3|nr:hypothetical protein [Steroidobacter sp.]MBL8264956.1 hypothetical protein [Steroidobacter sp.]